MSGGKICYYCESRYGVEDRIDLLWKSIQKKSRTIPLCKKCVKDIKDFVEGRKND